MLQISQVQKVAHLHPGFRLQSLMKAEFAAAQGFQEQLQNRRGQTRSLTAEKSLPIIHDAQGFQAGEVGQAFVENIQDVAVQQFLFTA